MKLRQWFATAVLIAAAVLTPAAQTAAPTTIPARLSDAEFWKLTTECSEPNGYFSSDNFVGNELSFQWVIPSLAQTVKPGGVYMGVGPDQNFTYIASLAPSIAFIVDVRRDNFMELLMYKALLELSATRAEFAAMLFSRPVPTGVAPGASADVVLKAVFDQPPSRDRYEHNIDAITTRLTKTHGFPLTPEEIRSLNLIYGSFFTYGPGISYSSGSFRNNTVYPTYWDMQVTDDNAGVNHAYMSSDAAFGAIKRMEEANLIVPVTGNFGGPKAVRAVGGWIRAHGGVVTTFYTSNVEQYLFQDNIWRQWYDNVASLPLDETSTFIRSVFNGQAGYMNFSSRGLRSAQLTSSIPGLIAAYKSGKINSYYDVIAFSK